MSLEITEEIIARQPPEAQAIIRLLLAKIAELEARIEELERRVKARRRRTPRCRPARNIPTPSRSRQKRKSKKKRGGQPGHEKHERPLIPTEQCDEIRRSSRPNADAAARSSRAATQSRCGIRCGNCPKSSPT